MSAQRRTAPAGIPRRAPGRAIRAALAALALAGAASAVAQAGGGFEIARWNAGPGGSRVAGGAFTGTGTLGQAETARLQGGVFVLQGGFHRRATAGAPADALFGSGFE